MAEHFEVSGIIPTTTSRIYAAWLDGDSHAKMTGSAAAGQAVVGGRHSAWDGYITGANLELQPSRRIVQSWRTTEFPADAPDSRLEILLEPVAGGTRIIIRHGNVPDGQGLQYQSGWRDHYLTPMTAHFGMAAKPAKKKAAAKPAKKLAKAPAIKASAKKPAKKPTKKAKSAPRKAKKR